MNRQQTHAETSAGAVHAILVHSMKICQVLKDKNLVFRQKTAYVIRLSLVGSVSTAGS